MRARGTRHYREKEADVYHQLWALPSAWEVRWWKGGTGRSGVVRGTGVVGMGGRYGEVVKW